jgi:hypothetical protein
MLQVIRRLAGSLALAYLLADGIARRFAFLNRLNGFAPDFVEADGAIDGRRERIESTAPAQASAKCVDALAHHLQIMH